MTVTISNIPVMMMHENTMKALSVCLSVFTSLLVALSRSFGLCIFIDFSYLGLQGAGMPS